MGANDFTPREQEILAFAWQCFEEAPRARRHPLISTLISSQLTHHQVNIKKLAGLCGMTNQGSATNAWAKIKKKIEAQGKELSGEASPTKANGTPKATPTPRKRTKKAADEDVDDEESPAKKAKGRKAKSEAKVDEEEDGEDEKSVVKAENADEFN